MNTLNFGRASNQGMFRACYVILLALGMIVPAHAQSVTVDNFNPGPTNGWSYPSSLAIQPDDKILVGGSFVSMGGFSRSFVVRLNAGGDADLTFDPDPNAPVVCFGLEPDLRIQFGGLFNVVGGQPRYHIARVNPDGTANSQFSLGANRLDLNPADIWTVAVQADGKILVGGKFTDLDGKPRSNLGRFHTDGTLDTNFVPSIIPQVTSLALQPDGKILVGLYSDSIWTQTANDLLRLNPDGSIDTGFNPRVNAGGNGVYCIAVQADGKILVGGIIHQVGGQRRLGLARLHASGALDGAFNPMGETSYGILSLALQADGRILVGGRFDTIAGHSRTNLARLNPDGTLDTTFDAGAIDGFAVNALALQMDGKILVAGSFTTLGGLPRNGIGRMVNTEPAAQTLTYDGSNITWTVGGTSPEMWLTTFESFSNGVPVHSGQGRSIPGGWEIAAPNLPANATIRARGFVNGNNSSWFAETAIGPAVILEEPADRTTSAATTATFGVRVTGSPATYQWQKDGVNLQDNNLISGANTPILTLRTVLGDDSGSYSVVISNLHGSVTSAEAVLTVVDPFITRVTTSLDMRWMSRQARVGETVECHVTITGTAPMSFHWLKDGIALQDGSRIQGAGGATLTLTPILPTDAGRYSVIASNNYGSVTSSPASIEVTAPIQAGFTTIVTGFEVPFVAQLCGAVGAFRWEFGDGTFASNQVQVSHAWSEPGDYEVVLRADDDRFPSGFIAAVTVHVVSQPVHFVRVDSTTPVPPYASWATAARTIQDAIDSASVVGSLVLVSNGIYQTGGFAVHEGMTNRVAVTKPLTVRTVNGPDVTVIRGYQVSGTTNGDGAVRCAYLTNGATLSGFTLTGGAVMETGGHEFLSGGGVWCESLDVVVSNCVLTGNSAVYGGAAFSGTLNHCRLIQNTAATTTMYPFRSGGGGAVRSRLNNCTLASNTALFGGGAYQATLNQCTLTGNAAENGGGASHSTLNQCTLISNTATNGGGACEGTLGNCLLVGNVARFGGGAYGGYLDNSTLVQNVASDAGGGVWAMITVGLTGCGGDGCFPIPECGACVGGWAHVNNCIILENAAPTGSNHCGFTGIGYLGWPGFRGVDDLSTLQGGIIDYSCTTPLPTNGIGNITNAPLFVDAAVGDFRLQSNSPCINAGRNAFAPTGPDLDGNSRIVGGTVDMGAYEFQSPQSMLSYAWLQQYGFPVDGSADFADPDGDGHNNWQEWRSQTDPTNSLSVLRLLSPIADTNGIRVRWQSVAGQNYFLERGGNLGTSPVFTFVADNVLGQPDHTSFTDTNTVGPGSFFYRIGVKQ